MSKDNDIRLRTTGHQYTWKNMWRLLGGSSFATIKLAVLRHHGTEKGARLRFSGKPLLSPFYNFVFIFLSILQTA